MIRKVLRLALCACFAASLMQATAGTAHADAQSPAEYDWNSQNIDFVVTTWKQRIFFTFQQDKFEQLERWHTMALEQTPRAGSGTFILPEFYAGFHFPEPMTWSPEQLVNAEKAWENHFSWWSQSYPKSAAPYLAKAEYLYNRGWLARGNGFANTVFEDSWKDYKEFLEQARQHLVGSAAIASAEGHYYVLLAKIEFELTGDHAAMIARLKEGLARHPDYHLGFTQAANYLTPMWKGDPQLYYSWADQAAKTGGPTDGTGLLARMYWKSAGGPLDYADIQDKGPYWPKLKLALSDELARFPHLENQLRFLYLACMAGDLEAAAPHLTEMKKMTGNTAYYGDSIESYCAERQKTHAEKR